MTRTGTSHGFFEGKVGNLVVSRKLLIQFTEQKHLVKIERCHESLGNRLTLEVLSHDSICNGGKLFTVHVSRTSSTFVNEFYWVD